MNKFYSASPFILQTLIWIPTRFILWLFADFEVNGLENLRQLRDSKLHPHSGLIFASNHTSELDPIILPAGLPFFSRYMPIFYTSREKAFYKLSGFKQFFYGGTFFKLWGSHPIYAGLRDYEKALVNHVELLKAGKSVMIFPEGKIRREGVEPVVHGGVAFLAAKTGCPIIPIAISGASGMSTKDFFLRRRKIVLNIGAPIFTPEIEITLEHPKVLEQSINTYKEIAVKVMEKVDALR